MYTLAEEHPCRKGSRGWRLLRQESKVLVSKKARGCERYAHFPEGHLRIYISLCNPSLGPRLSNTTKMSQCQTGFFQYTDLEPEQHRYASTVLQQVCSFLRPAEWLHCSQEALGGSSVLHSLPPQQGGTGNALTGGECLWAAHLHVHNSF